MRALGFVILFLMVAGSNTRSAEWFGNASRPWRIYKYNSTACNNQTREHGWFLLPSFHPAHATPEPALTSLALWAVTSQDWIVKSKVIEKQTFVRHRIWDEEHTGRPGAFRRAPCVASAQTISPF